MIAINVDTDELHRLVKCLTLETDAVLLVSRDVEITRGEFVCIRDHNAWEYISQCIESVHLDATTDAVSLKGVGAIRRVDKS